MSQFPLWPIYVIILALFPGSLPSKKSWESIFSHVSDFKDRKVVESLNYAWANAVRHQNGYFSN